MKDNSNFIKTIMQNDLDNFKHETIITRFPPEPNGYLHIGHARAVIINFELAKVFGGKTNLRFDDTNPVKEDTEYVDAIKEDITWLGYEPDNVYFASDYFQEMYERAVLLIKKGKAYVCDLTQEEMSKYRGNLTSPGTDSPYRNRSVEENLALFEGMKNGQFKEGEKVLRAKIDMKSPNMNMRDPGIYRISFSHHHNTQDKWCIYPIYDYAHPLEDAIEGITHSLCSLEFEDHRPLYDWVVRECEMPLVPRQIEFGRLGITNTVMSKRFLKQLVDLKHVVGWDDPRMPTLRGLRRRGYTPSAIREFILAAGLSRTNSTISSDMLEHFVREDLKLTSKRPMAVLKPLAVEITNYPEGKVEYVDVDWNNENEALGSRKVAFSRHLVIEQDDFLEEKPNKHWKRLSLGLEVRLFGAYFIKANEVVKDEEGNVIKLLCTYDENTKSGSGFNERKPNGTIHYCEVSTGLKATFNLFEPLIVAQDADEDKSFLDRLNPTSWTKLEGFVEQALEDTVALDKFQFLRNGYFTTDLNSSKMSLEFNRIVELKSSFK